MQTIPSPEASGRTPVVGQRHPDNGCAALLSSAKQLALPVAGLAVCFALPLSQLVQFALHSVLYSHIILVPFASLYLVWLKRRGLPDGLRPAPRLALALALPGLIGVAAWWLGSGLGWKPALQDRLCLLTLSFVSLFWGVCAWRLGGRAVRVVTAALALLVFAAPFPMFLEGAIETFLQHASAEAAYLLLKVSGTPIFRQGLVFVLPGISLEVAPQCSGIHSTLALFITALVAGELFLRRPASKLALALAVVLMGILRNGARIVTLAQLCIHVDPGMLDSDLHRRGGPLFFAASLVPCFLLIWWLHRLDLRANPRVQP
jgi:exosortase C (VPDSG-CTERM-specific)